MLLQPAAAAERHLSTAHPSPAPMSLEPTSAGGGFASFSLDRRIVDALGALGFETPTPIQAQAIEQVLEGRDLIGRARTGSGKTAAFGLPLLERVKDGGAPVRALVLTPTRELALQVTEALRSYATKLPVSIVTIYGGASYGPQNSALRRGVPIVVGTPGRVLDHLRRGSLDLSQLEMLVLDEADEMLRMGFLEDVETVLAAAPAERQVLLFSATMPAEIRRVAASHLRDPIEIQVEERALCVDHITQKRITVPQRHKLDALGRVLAAEFPEASLVFVRTRAACAEVADALAKSGVDADALHGELGQGARERVLQRLRSGRLRVVVATDVAARGIDVEHITHVINFDLPSDVESYVHRIGRTGRAGRAGTAIAFVTPAEERKVRWLERSLRVAIAPMTVPSDRAIQDARLERMVAELRAAEVPEALEALLDTLEEETSLRAIALGALARLSEKHGLDLSRPADAEPPRWARAGFAPRKGRGRERSGAARAPRPEGDEIELFFPVGAARGVRPGDLVGALANDTGIAGSDVGRITVLPHKSFVRLSREAGERVLAAHDELELRGRRVPIAKARPRSGEHAPRKPFGGRGKGRPKGPKGPRRAGPHGKRGKGGKR